MKINKSALAINSKWIFVLACLSILFGCASGISNSVKITEDDLAKFNVMTPEEAIQDLEKSIKEAKNENLPFLTPSFYKEVDELYIQAKKSVTDGKAKKSIIHDIAKADRLLAKAKVKKRIVQAKLRELLAINDSLLKFEAISVFTKDYEKIKIELKNIIVKIEASDDEKIGKDKERLLPKFVALETKVIKYTALHEADEIKTQAKLIAALKLAPVTYAEAVRAYQKSDANISQYPHDKKLVAEAKKQALFAAKHALVVTKRVIELKEKYKKSPESIIIDEDSRVLSISKVINNSDVRDKSISDQFTTLVDLIQKLNADSVSNDSNIESIAKLEQELVAKNESIEKLEKQLSEYNENTKLTNVEIQKLKKNLVVRNDKIDTLKSDVIRLRNTESNLLLMLEQHKTKLAKLNSVKPKAKKPEEQKITKTENVNDKTVASKNEPILKTEEKDSAIVDEKVKRKASVSPDTNEVTIKSEPVANVESKTTDIQSKKVILKASVQK